jgi:hypothetical protein
MDNVEKPDPRWLKTSTLGSVNQHAIEMAQREAQSKLSRQVAKMAHIPIRQAQQVVAHSTHMTAPEIVSGIKPLAGGDPPQNPVTAASGDFFKLVPFEDSGTQKVKVLYSTVGGVAPTAGSGFSMSGSDYVYTPSGTEKVYAKVVYSDSDGSVTTRTIEKASSVPANTTGNAYEEIGTSTSNGSDPATVANGRYGPIPFKACRNYGASSAPYYGASFTS